MTQELPKEFEEIAGELRSAFSDPDLSEHFRAVLQARIQEKPWSLRGAFVRSPLLRVAATVLLMLSVAAPGAALFALWKDSSSEVNPIEVRFREPAPSLENSPPDVLKPVAPEEFAVDAEYAAPGLIDFKKKRRLALAVAHWSSHGRTADLQPAWPGLRLEISPVNLWENLEAALVSQQESIPADTERQVRDAWSRCGPNDEVWLAPWMWVLDNEIPENFQGQWHDLFEAALQAQAHPRR